MQMDLKEHEALFQTNYFGVVRYCFLAKAIFAVILSQHK